MPLIRFAKVVSSLPATLQPNTVYLVRVGTGFDMYVSDLTGSVAHKCNTGDGASVVVDMELDGGRASSVYLLSQIVDGGRANG